jgi:hypothetical protein
MLMENNIQNQKVEESRTKIYGKNNSEKNSAMSALQNPT